MVRFFRVIDTYAVPAILVSTYLVLIATSAGQLYRWRLSGLTPFAEAHWPQLAAEIPKDLLALGDGRYALSFRRTAPWLLDSEGNILRRLAIDDGAP